MIEQQLGTKATIEVGNTGEYSVWVDGSKVYDKTGQRFPDEAEIVALLRDR